MLAIFEPREVVGGIETKLRFELSFFFFFFSGLVSRHAERRVNDCALLVRVVVVVVVCSLDVGLYFRAFVAMYD